MFYFVKIWNRTTHEIPSEEDFLRAAKDVYNLLMIQSMAKGEVWSLDPELICHLEEFIPWPNKQDKSMTFMDYLKKAFKEKTGIDWNPEEYVLVAIPSPLAGDRRHFVVFKK
jgi:hypothetical protein